MKHQKWLLIINQNKSNYYVELIKSKELIENQKRIIKDLENQIQKKLLTIDYLTEQLTFKNKNIESIDLLDIN